MGTETYIHRKLIFWRLSMNTLKLILASLVLSILAACSGGGSDSSGQGNISGIATKGPLNNATVMAYAISNGQIGAKIATVTTDANGNYTMNTGSYTGGVMLQVSGGTYTDEATGTIMSMVPGDVMTAVIPNIAVGAAISGIQVTPITAMAQAMAQHMTGGMTDINIAAANTAMGSYFTVNDIIHTQPMNPLLTGSGTGASTDAQNYGMALAAISQYAQTQGMATSSAMVTALMNDASDGVMDGKAGSTAVQMGGMTGGVVLPATAGTSDLGASMNTFMTSARNKSGVTTTSLMTKLNGATGQMLGSSPGMVNATLSGTVFNGPMSKATVKAYAISNGAMSAQVASVSTDGQGNFTLPLGSYTGAVMLQMSGGTYTDEATGTNMDMAVSDVMSAVLPTVVSGENVSGIWVTPVTSMAQTRALAMNGGMTDANINAANTAMGNYFTISDILKIQPMNPLVLNSGNGATTDMRNYGAAIAAMSEYAKTNTTAVSSTFVTAMMNDASDGVMNGKMGSSQITMPMSGGMGGGMNGMGNMALTAGTSGLATAMTGFINSVANASGLTATDMTTLTTKLTNSNGQI
jgi:hypothetical protein